MNLIVSDSGPLRYLILCGRAEVLPKMFETVIVPGEVVAELAHISAPKSVQAWAAAPPPWLRIESSDLEPFEPGRDVGEFAAIRLAVRLEVKTLLCDDLAARRLAMSQGLEVLGTLGFLEAAAKLGLLDLQSTLASLLNTNFRISAELVRDMILRAGDDSGAKI